MLELFYEMVYRNYIPMPLKSKKYKMYEAQRIVIEALLALADD